MARRRSSNSVQSAQRSAPKPSTPPRESVAVIPRSEFGKSLVNWLFPAYVLMIAFGYGVLVTGAGTVRGNEIGSDRCLFHVINAATLTGFSATIGVHEFTIVGQTLSLLLMVGGAMFSLVVGGLAMTRILRLPYSDGHVIGASVVLLAIAGVGGGAVLMVTGHGFFDSIFLAVSCFANCGLTSGGDPSSGSAITHLLLLPLSILGGMGVTVLLELCDVVRRRSKLSVHASTTLAGLAVVYVVGFVALLVLQWPDGFLSSDGWRDLLASTSAMSINSRSLGLPLEYATSLSRSVVWMLIVLMTIGAGSGGTAGGLKVSTLAELLRGVRSALTGKPISRGFGIAMVWIGIYAVLALITQLLLLHQADKMPADRIFFLSISALSNVGLSHDPLSITRDGLYTLSAAMFAGRVAPLLVLWWMADTTTDADVAVG